MACMLWVGLSGAAAAETARPMIWVEPADRAAIVKMIGQHDWAKAMYGELKARADAAVPGNGKERREKLLALPLVWPEDGSAPTLPSFRKAGGIQKTDEQLRWGYPKAPQMALMKAQQDAIDCGVLYYLTGEEKYAMAAADVLATFVNALDKTPVKKGGGNSGWVYDDHLLEARILGAQLPIIYDFVAPYLRNGGKVYDLASGEVREFDFAAAQKVFKTYVDLALNRGSRHNNWTVLETTSLLHNLLAIEDADERTRLLRHFVDKDTNNQGSLKYVYRHFKQPGDMWPESLAYSGIVTRLSIYHMTLVDRIDPDLKLGRRFRNIPESITALYNLLFPNGDRPYFGDTNRPYGPSYRTYEMALQLARLNQNEDQIQQFSDFLSASIAGGRYDRGKLSERRYGAGAYTLPVQLLWAVEDIGGDATADAEPPRPRSNHLPYAGLTIQRNISSSDPVNNSLMAVVGGGSFVHSHASGMFMELYGRGHVLGIDGGKSTYGTPIHENYYRLFAAHNTVISNGASASKGGWANLGIDRVTPIALEPEAGEPGVSPNHSFATTSFTDKHNLVAPAEHQRTVALIRLSDEQGYYVDVFRAKSDTPEQYHDYVYHNAGDRLAITSRGQAVRMKTTPERYQAPSQREWRRNRAFEHPGWHYFEDVKTSEPSAAGYEARFIADELGDESIVMEARVPAGLETEITQVNAPPSRAAPGGYTKKPLPTFLLRHRGEAWSNPFVVVYEPHAGKSAVKSVERLMADSVFKGVKVTAEVNGKTVTQYVLIQEKMDDVYANEDADITFKGQVAVVTVVAGQGVESMYIGRGHELVYADRRLETDGTSHAAYRVFGAE